MNIIFILSIFLGCSIVIIFRQYKKIKLLEKDILNYKKIEEIKKSFDDSILKINELSNNMNAPKCKKYEILKNTNQI